ncbi:DUF2799 domain-containing protein [Roseateles oligotrophus]|uniref:DUF2799 domain-containing protein n=1 Tax=Roseateles oligotrophus TaxID=1769250 RepID=A0ABT2YC32_9BURK|nr:DUF2799 domain-containing protein [Roseateles oligotrophus]MCV2367588.1 DUF2799 domain-containing protein [Roseateles oligotrophus]
MLTTFGRLALAPLFGLLLTSCATMSPEECKVADWGQIGQRDGMDGRTLGQLSDRAADCAKVGVSVDTQAYQKGRDQGLLSYCRPDNALRVGLSGGFYGGVCPPETHAEFLQRYESARYVWDLRNEVSSLDGRIENLERRLRDVNRSEEKRLADATTDEQRKAIRKAIDDERRDIRNDLSETDRRLRRKRDELRSAEFSLSNLR